MFITPMENSHFKDYTIPTNNSLSSKSGRKSQLTNPPSTLLPPLPPFPSSTASTPVNPSFLNKCSYSSPSSSFAHHVPVISNQSGHVHHPSNSARASQYYKRCDISDLLNPTTDDNQLTGIASPNNSIMIPSTSVYGGPCPPFVPSSSGPPGNFHNNIIYHPQTIGTMPPATNDPILQSSEDLVRAFRIQHPYINYHQYPMTLALLGDSMVDKAKKKKGGYRCSGTNCRENCTFTNILELAKHLDELCTKNEFKCEIANCPYRYIGFGTLGSLKRHGKIHESNSDVFQCSYCERSFKNVFNKHRHEKQLHHA